MRACGGKWLRPGFSPFSLPHRGPPRPPFSSLTRLPPIFLPHPGFPPSPGCVWSAKPNLLAEHAHPNPGRRVHAPKLLLWAVLQALLSLTFWQLTKKIIKGSPSDQAQYDCVFYSDSCKIGEAGKIFFLLAVGRRGMFGLGPGTPRTGHSR